MAPTRLPITGPDLFGREADLEWLDACWSEGVHVASIVAFGGVGKTALVGTWRNRLRDAGWGGAERVFDWSFYSQGTSDKRVGSADEFVSAALRWFGDPEPTAGSPWDKGDRLAELVRGHRTLLILDGMEPLQGGPGVDEGSIKDPALQALVRGLAGGHAGLCVITTRFGVADLASLAGEKVREKRLEHLSAEAGARLLEQRGAKGPEDELRAAAEEYGGHCLALTLLGSYLEDACEGDLRRRKEIGPLEGDERFGKHAHRMMAAYEKWFKGGPEIAILRMLGLFDRPADEGEIAALRKAPVIGGLTDTVTGFGDQKWKKALARLRRVGLVAADAQDKRLDAHPLVREHFGEQVKQAYPEAWREGHRRLYEHLKETAKQLPETIEEMVPLYAAVIHGCRGGKHQETLLDIFRRRIRRESEAFSLHELGAFSADVATLAAFFDPPWEKLAPGLSESDQAYIWHAAGFAQRALGRLDEAVRPMRMALASYVAQEKWTDAAIAASNLSSLCITRGDLSDALRLARQSVDLANKTGDAFQMMTTRILLATALHEMGHRREAEDLAEAEQTNVWQTVEAPRFSIQVFRICTILLDQGRNRAVLEHVPNALEESKRKNWLLAIALNNISLARAHMQHGAGGDLTDAHLQEAVEALRHAGRQEYLLLGLLARADLYTHTRAFDAARRDLAEVLTLATRCGFRLHEADTHLAYARLHLADCDPAAAREHLAQTRALIHATGYHRRDEELERLEAMTRDQLLDTLCNLLPAQFDLLLAKLSVPPACLSSAHAPLATRATEMLRYMEAQSRVADLERALAGAKTASTPAPAAAPASVSASASASAFAPVPVPAPVDFLILTALEEEREAVLAKLPGYKKLDGDGTDVHVYFDAKIATTRHDKAVYRVLVTTPASMGPIHAAITASAVTERHRPEHVILVGIAGGLTDEVALGDVMVAKAVSDYTVGKVHEDGTREERWESYPADAGLLNAANAFRAGWEDLVAEPRPEGTGKPARHAGVIASGGDVIASKDVIAAYHKDWPKLIGVEMEGGGVAAALHHQKLRPRFLMIRGVSDLADGEGNAGMKKRWRAYARDVAAAYAIGLLRDGPVPRKLAR